MTNSTLDQIVALAAGIAPPGVAVTQASSFDQLHFDSLDTIDFTVAVEDRFNVVIGCADRIQLDTLADVARLVDGQLAPAAMAA